MRKKRLVVVEVGDVFEISWTLTDKETTVYKAYNIRDNVVDCVCINTNSGYVMCTFFVADYYDIKGKYAVIDFQDLDVRFLPKLKALLYEPILDEHWKKHCDDSKSKTR